MTAYFGMTAHFITEDWKVEMELLSFEEMDGSHSGENQAAHLYKVLKRFAILNKVCILTSIPSTILASDITIAWIFYGRQCVKQ